MVPARRDDKQYLLHLRGATGDGFRGFTAEHGMTSADRSVTWSRDGGVVVAAAGAAVGRDFGAHKRRPRSFVVVTVRTGRTFAVAACSVARVPGSSPKRITKKNGLIHLRSRFYRHALVRIVSHLVVVRRFVYFFIFAPEQDDILSPYTCIIRLPLRINHPPSGTIELSIVCRRRIPDK